MLQAILLGVLGGSEILIILVIILILFGGKKIPELMRGIGKGVREFKDGMDGAGENSNNPNANKGQRTIDSNTTNQDQPVNTQQQSNTKTQ